MPTHPNTVQLAIKGFKQTAWDSYDIDSDLLIPADAFQFSLSAKQLNLPDYVATHQPVSVTIDGDRVLSGQIDDIDESVAKNGQSLSITGRDKAGQLLDCSARIFEAQSLSLVEIIRKVIYPFGLKPQVLADKSDVQEKVTIEPGESPWDALAKVCEANGLWQWFSPEGVLTIGDPNPQTPTVADLVINRDGQGNNALSIRRLRSGQSLYSEIMVWSQSNGTDIAAGQTQIKGSAFNRGVYNRFKLVGGSDCDNVAMANAKARKQMVDSVLNSHTITVTVQGHRTPSGALWTPSQRVKLVCDYLKLDGTFFIMGRRFKCDRMTGQTTELRLKDDGIWQLNKFKAAIKGRRKKPIPFETLELPND